MASFFLFVGKNIASKYDLIQASLTRFTRFEAYHLRSLNSNGGWNITAGTSLLNTRLFEYASEIRSAVLIVHGEKAHSRYLGEEAFKLLKGDNKELSNFLNWHITYENK